MSSAGGVDEDDIESFGGGVGDSVARDISGVFAVAALVEFDGAETFAGGEGGEVGGVHAELFDGAGAECVAGGDEEGEVVLEQEEGEFGEGGGFADAVDADDGDCVGAAVVGLRGWGARDGGYGAEDVEGGCGGEEFGEGG